MIGLVWQLGPCSAYDIRRHMHTSPSTQWSGSAGAIYPLVQRLQRRGLLSARTQRSGRRTRRVYAATPAGVKVLRSWIGPPLPADAVTVTYDPLRSRARFLAALTPKQQRAWIAEARRALERVREQVRAWQETYGDAAGMMAGLVTRNGELDVEFRTRWIDEVDRAVR